MVENSEISSLAPFLGYGGSGDGEEPLPRGFRGCCRYCPPSKTAKKLEEICNFKQEEDETLYQVWERAIQALMVIQFMADHSQKLHDGSSSRNIESSSNSEGIATIVNKLKNLGRDMKKLKENVHPIQVGCQTVEELILIRTALSRRKMPNCGGAHLDKDCPFKEEVKSIEEAKYGEFGRPSPFKDVAKDPRERSFDDYKWMFDLEINRLKDEYELEIGKKGHMPEGIWENYRKVQRDNTYWWHDQKLEEEERQKLEINIKEYEPPTIYVETFKVKRYSFDTGQSFICVTKEFMDALPMGRENGSRFRDMIRFFYIEIGIRGLLESYSYGSKILSWRNHLGYAVTDFIMTAWRETLILGEFPTITFHTYCPNSQKKMDHQYPTVAKIPVLDIEKFEQWQFRIQQYLQHEYYALWEVIEFGDSYKIPENSDSVDSRKKDGRTVTVTIDDMQKKKNDVGKDYFTSISS
nr:hypothetical protein [Tanacetum cinerariifolium]